MNDFLRQNFQLISLFGGALVVCSAIIWAIIYYLTYAVRSQILGKTFWCGHAKDNSVALTFDDGPSPDTEYLLDVLQAENVKATFFLIGKNVEEFPEITRRIVKEGHEIGNHSFSHPIFLLKTYSQTRRELERTQKIIESTTGVTPKIARPPCGVRSLAYFSTAKALNLQTIQWSDTGFDWKNLSAEKISANVLKNVQSGSIILLHDGDSAEKSDRRATVKSIPLILQGLKTKGLHVSPLAEMINRTPLENKYLMEKTLEYRN